MSVNIGMYSDIGIHLVSSVCCQHVYHDYVMHCNIQGCCHTVRTYIDIVD